MKVFVTGATGLVGSALLGRLSARGDEVIALTRNAAAARARFSRLPRAPHVVEGDPAKPGAWQQAMLGSDAVIHLAGESVFDKRWSSSQKDRLWKSRVASTELIATTIEKSATRPKILVTASAVGYYGARRDREADESATPGKDFLARLCMAWEAAARGVEARGVRLATVRVGIVLAREGGALAKMIPPFKMGVGGPIGDGNQGVSWIHIDDLVSMIIKIIDDAEMRGVFNGTAPNPVSNEVFSKALARQLHRPCALRVPETLLRLAFGEVAEVLAGGQRAIPKRLSERGFHFAHTDVAEALQSLFEPVPTQK